MKKQPELIRGLGPIGAAAMVVGTVIGTGIFLVPSSMARAVDSVGLVFAVWVVGGLLSLAGALSYAELGAAMPEAGGEYVFLRRAYGPLWGFLYGWEQFVIGKTGSIATIATAFALFLGFFFDTLQQPWLAAAGFSLTGAQIISLVAIITLTVINYLGVVAGGAVQTVFTILKVAVILGLVVLGFAIGNGDWSNFSPFLAAPKGFGGTFSAIGVALVAALWAYDGWNNLVMVGGEIKDPQRNIPRALIFGVLGVGLVYMLANAVYFYLLPLEAVKGSTRVAQDAARSFLGEWGGIVLTMGALISTFATLNAAILSGARVPYAMARDRLFLRSMASVHPIHRTPDKALLLQAALSCGLVLIFGQSQDAFDRLFTFTIFGLWIFYGMTTASVIWLRHKAPRLPRPYRTLGYPWVPGLFVVLAAVFCINTLVRNPTETGLGLAFLAAGLPFYWFWRRRGAPSDRGIERLLPWVTGEIEEEQLLTPDSFPQEAAEELRAAGPAGSAALAALIRELLDCRSPRITWALAVAERVEPSPALVDAIRSIISAPGIREGGGGRFAPEIVGAGKIGWTDGTEARVRQVGTRVLGALTQGGRKT